MSGLTIFWLLAAVGFAVVESLTTQIVCIWFCIGSVVSALLAYFTNSVWITSVAFVIVSATTLFLTRPIVKKKLIYRPEPTNADRILGKNAVVISKINPSENAGQIKIDGQVWSAKSDGVIEEGETVKIERIEGVKAVVTK